MSRRRTHPLGLPPRGGGPNPATVAREDEPVSGPQSDLCLRTMCAVCFVVWGATRQGRDWIPDYTRKVDWRRMPALDENNIPCEPHHEPHRTQGGLDSDCIPLCAAHHRLGGFSGKPRHDYGKAIDFYRPYGIDVDEVKAEMRRRVTT